MGKKQSNPPPPDISKRPPPSPSPPITKGMRLELAKNLQQPESITISSVEDAEALVRRVGADCSAAVAALETMAVMTRGLTSR